MPVARRQRLSKASVVIRLHREAVSQARPGRLPTCASPSTTRSTETGGVDELDAPPGVEEPVLPYGLFTSVANSVYAPGAFPEAHGSFAQSAEPDPKAGAATLRRRLLPGAAAPGGKALRRPELGRRQVPVERARGWHGARSRFLGIPPRAHRRTHQKAERGSTGRRRPLRRRNQQVVRVGRIQVAGRPNVRRPRNRPVAGLSGVCSCRVAAVGRSHSPMGQLHGSIELWDASTHVPTSPGIVQSATEFGARR